MATQSVLEGQAVGKPAEKAYSDPLEIRELKDNVKLVWEYFEFLAGYFEGARELKTPAAVRGLTMVLFDLMGHVNDMGECIGLHRESGTVNEWGKEIDQMANLSGKDLASFWRVTDLRTGILALHDQFEFLDTFFISDRGYGIDRGSAEGLRTLLAYLHGQVSALADLAEAGQVDQAGEAKPGRVVPFKAPATPAGSGPVPETPTAAGVLRFARDLDPVAEPTSAPRRGFLWWLNPRNWTR